MLCWIANVGNTVCVSHIVHTSSRARACLNILIVLLVPTKGSVRRLRTPTLATVSLRDAESIVILGAGRMGIEYEPHSKELYRHFATEGPFETNCQPVRPGARRLIQLVCEVDLLEIVFGQQAYLIHKVGAIM
jgi:hypothetical protein